MAARGTNTLSPDADSCLRWLDTKDANSVVYVSFGTLTSFSTGELRELARGLHLSGKNFVWVLRGAGAESSEWMPEDFAELMERGERGFIVRGWAPQMLILNHAALGGFVTHCGWNSTLEAVSAGVPMVTWPRYADQFNNEMLIVEVLKVGVSIGAKDYASSVETHEVIGGEVIAESISRLMGNTEEGDAIQKKAKDLGVKARSAVENGGSSYNDVGRLMLDGSLPGDFGFDPWGLGSDPESLRWNVQAELVHCRWAMLGAAGIFIPELLTKIGILNTPSWYTAGEQTYFADTTTLFIVELILIGWAEGRRWADIIKPGCVNTDPIFPNNKLTGTDVGYPGGLWFDPLGYGSGSPEKIKELRTKEIKNGRLAMLAVMGAWFQAEYTGTGPIDNLFAHLADPGHATIFRAFTPN